MPHQKKAFAYAVQRARIALFMEMRLGKTLVAIRWAEREGLKRILVVAPVSVLPGWVEELQQERWADEDILLLSTKDPVVKRVEIASQSKVCWTLANYETVNFGRKILSLDWDCVILDESTRIKNPKADITKVLIKGCQFIGHRAILTGLPAPESELDYCEQFRFIHDNFMHQHDFWWWRKKYFMKCGHDWVPRSGTIKLIERYVSDHAFVMSAEQAGIGNKKIYERRFLNLTPAQRKLYKQIEQDFEYEDGQKEYQTTKYIPVKLSWMHRICGGFSPSKDLMSDAKLSEIDGLLRGDLKGKSAVIWFKHTAEMERARELLSSYGCAFFNAKEKSGEAEFKAGKKRLMIAQAKCGRYGLDWSVADVAIYYSNWWSHETRAQSEKRIEHPKKKRPLLYIDLLCADSIDEDVLKALKGKAKTSKQFLDAVMQNWRERKCR